MNFTIDNTVNVNANNNSYLEGNKIHTVTFKGAEMVTLEAKSGQSYEIVQCTFENADGIFQDSFFEPGPDAMEKKPNMFDGFNPSGFEQMVARIRHYISALNPDLHVELENGTKKLQASTWNQLRQIIVKAFAKGVDKEVQIKLLKNKNNMATFPGFPLSTNKKGEVYMNTRFIGDKLTFTPKELTKITEQESATATNMGDSVTMGDTGSSKADDFDFNIDDL